VSGDWSRTIDLLRSAGVCLDPGLSAAELDVAQSVVGAPFPPDLRELLTLVLPCGGRFPNWRSPESVREQLRWPLEGIEFDVENNVFWLESWGPRAEELEQALAIVRAKVAQAPALIPICGHRYLPSEPPEAGNPVFSVYQTDIIYYGDDLRSYFAVEFGSLRYEAGVTGKVRPIRFWGELAE
jgi:hypothetical protein